jgi:hypothetical protein
VNRFRTQPHGVDRSTSQLLSQETTHNGVNRFTSQLTSRCEPVKIPTYITVWTGSDPSFPVWDITMWTGSHLRFRS